MGVKVAIVGAGSTYTPELVEGFIRRADRFPVDELALLDVDPTRLGIVGGLARRMLDRAGFGGRTVLTGDRDEAIDGAAFVIVQLRVGGQAARLLDETIPLRFGCVGQETTGPGGFAKALRTVPMVLELAEITARRGAPGCWFIDFTNPTGLVTQALLDREVRAIGLCNVAIGFQRRFAERFGVEPERVELEHVGLNHLSWVRAVKVDGVDRLPELLETDLAGLSALGAVPSYYLRYYYRTREMFERQTHGTTRAEEVARIEHDLLELYRDPELAEKPRLLERRGGAFYSEAAAQLVASLASGTGDVQVVNARNAGAIANLAADDVVEVAATVGTDGAHPIPVAPLGQDMLGLVQHAKAYERLTIEAATTGDRSLALRALLTNPLAPDADAAAGLLDAILEANREHLPLFAR
jgi:6-phospho-beta-glucosidase